MNSIHRTEIEGPIYGPVHTGSGDIILADFESAFKELAKLLTTDHPALKSLRAGIEGLVTAYERLNEWKELHHRLQSLLIAFDPFQGIVDMAYAGGERHVTPLLRRYWTQCRIYIEGLKRFGASIRHIGEKKFSEDEEGLKGEPWVVDIVALAGEIERLLEEGSDIEALQRATEDFGARCFDYLEYADRNLREEARKLYGTLQQLKGRLMGYGLADTNPQRASGPG